MMADYDVTQFDSAVRNALAAQDRLVQCGQRFISVAGSQIGQALLSDANITTAGGDLITIGSPNGFLLSGTYYQGLIGVVGYVSNTVASTRHVDLLLRAYSGTGTLLQTTPYRLSLLGSTDLSFSMVMNVDVNGPLASGVSELDIRLFGIDPTAGASDSDVVLRAADANFPSAQASKIWCVLYESILNNRSL